MTKTYLKSYSELLLEAVDEAFFSLGENVKESVYFHLETKFGIKKREIPNKVDEFSNALEKIFSFGYRNLELLFMKQLHSKIGRLTIVPDVDLTFVEYICAMKTSFEAMQSKFEMGLVSNEIEKAQ